MYTSACCARGTRAYTFPFFSHKYLEKVLKESKQSVWMRNIQLATFSLLPASFGVSKDWETVREMEENARKARRRFMPKMGRGGRRRKKLAEQDGAESDG